MCLAAKASQVTSCLFVYVQPKMMKQRFSAPNPPVSCPTKPGSVAYIEKTMPGIFSVAGSPERGNFDPKTPKKCHQHLIPCNDLSSTQEILPCSVHMEQLSLRPSFNPEAVIAFPEQPPFALKHKPSLLLPCDITLSCLASCISSDESYHGPFQGTYEMDDRSRPDDAGFTMFCHCPMTSRIPDDEFSTAADIYWVASPRLARRSSPLQK